ncbi:unnamed protein product [Didymodactylos carnosus]|uniref:Uncharacterized protein n=1 Tax=Didymodactylos carnosus TaxID=1234261 RepID=A0A8S2FDG6_9BILA|nr:unnamed protein product [Didymodactylos carnosus]CAF4232545.1 unnamed protein product [Didymodactylos carnosus]
MRTVSDRFKFNSTIKNKIQRTLSLDVKNSTYCLLKSLTVYGRILSDLFGVKHQINITKQQRDKLTLYKLNSDSWNMINRLITVLTPFKVATKLISGSHNPTIGLTLFVLQNIRGFLENNDDDDELLTHLKICLLTKLEQYTTNDCEQSEAVKFLYSTSSSKPPPLSLLFSRLAPLPSSPSLPTIVKNEVLHLYI